MPLNLNENHYHKHISTKIKHMQDLVPDDKDKAIDEEFVIIEHGHGHTNCYSFFEIDKILTSWIETEINNKQLSFIEKSGNFTIVGDCKDKKIAIFSVTIDDPAFRLHQILDGTLTLEVALNNYFQYISRDDNRTCNRILIPIAETARGHFRLLEINPETSLAFYYDSKNYIVSFLAKIFYAFYESILLVESETTYKQGFINACNAWDQNYNYIKLTCKKYFSEIDFIEKPLSHQSIFNNVDCGPFTLEYAMQATFKETEDCLDPNQFIDITFERDIHDGLFEKQTSLFFKSKKTSFDANLKITPEQFSQLTNTRL